MSLRTRVVMVSSMLAGLGVIFACGSEPGESDFGSSSGASGSSGTSGGSSGNGFGSSGTTSSSGASGADANPANCKAPIDMYIMFDRSGSMANNGTDCNVGGTGTSKWCLGINALAGYLKSPGSKDHAAAIQFFSLPNHDEDWCDTGQNYDKANFPTTGYETLPSSNFDNVLNNTNPGGETPTEAAIRGIIGFTTNNRRPGRVTIGILVTDGNPNGCNENLDFLANLLQQHNTATKVRTYVIGMNGASFPNLEKIAKGGGAPTHAATVGTLTNACGTGGNAVAEPCTFWNVGNGEPAAFEAALAAIQESADGCKDGGGFINPGVN